MIKFIIRNDRIFMQNIIRYDYFYLFMMTYDLIFFFIFSEEF